MSELTIQQGIQAVLQAMSEFADDDVVINNWGILDQSNENAPYVIISNADTFRSRQDAPSEQNFWEEVVSLFESFSDWQTTLNNLRARRQAIVDQFNALAAERSANGLTATTVDEIRSGGPIEPYFDKGLSDEELRTAMPVFLKQDLIFVVEEF